MYKLNSAIYGIYFFIWKSNHNRNSAWQLYDQTGLFVFYRLRLFPNYIESARCKNIFEDLFHELPWKQRNDVKNGTTYAQPRLTAWCGDLPYSYSGVTLQPNCHVSTLYLVWWFICGGINGKTITRYDNICDLGFADTTSSPYNAGNLCINHGDQRCFFKFEIIINVLAISLRMIWIPMLWVYGNYKYFDTSVSGLSLDIRFWRIKAVPALKGQGKICLKIID